MNRRAFLSILSGSLLAAPLAAGAQPAGTVNRIGPRELHGGLEATRGAIPRRFARAGLRRGAEYRLEYRWAEGKYERFPPSSRRLLAQKGADRDH